MSCDEVLASVDRAQELRKGGAPNVKLIARTLGSTEFWVVRCMESSGRRIPSSVEHVEDEEDRLEQLEANEPEETAPEDVSEPGARERDERADENSQDRRELHVDNPLEPQREKERRLRVQPQSPNADGGSGDKGD